MEGQKPVYVFLVTYEYWEIQEDAPTIDYEGVFLSEEKAKEYAAKQPNVHIHTIPLLDAHQPVTPTAYITLQR